MRLLPAVLLLCAACLGGVPLPAPVRSTDKNAKTTVAVAEFVSRADWEQTGYYRPDQDGLIELPVLIALANDRTACIIDGRTWASWRDQLIVSCSSSWRTLRP